MRITKKTETDNYFSETETEQAFQTAKQKQMPVLIDFYAPGCKGCKKMEITTYQKDETLSYINSHFIFIKYDITNKSIPKIHCSPIMWTPTFIVFANDGSEMRKITGYLNNLQFISEMEIGRALAYLRKGKPQIALDILENFNKHPQDNVAAPEALYWAGVASYFLNRRNPESLAIRWQELLNNYPDSIWASKADCLHINL
jgi:thioredoxin-related protein